MVGASVRPLLGPARLEPFEHGLVGCAPTTGLVPGAAGGLLLRHDPATVLAVLALLDTATGQVAPLEPRSPGRLSVYMCGPTVSGSPHLGHGRFSIVWDTLRRYLTWSGLEVQFVSNVTDIEDKIIARAAEEQALDR